MTTQAKKRYIGILLVLAALVLVSGISFAARSTQTTTSAGVATGPTGDRPAGASAGAAAPAAPVGAQTSTDNPNSAIYRGVLPVAHFDVSPPLSSMEPAPFEPGQKNENEEMENQGAGKMNPNAPGKDTSIQKLLGPFAIPTAIISFNGNPNMCNCAPPDPTGEIGPNHFVQMSNLHYQIFDRSGNSLLGPLANNTLWAGFGGSCQTSNSGDPIVLYDQLADRWLLSQFTAGAAPFYNCIALSTSPDPTGTYYRWAFTTGGNFPDYPKYGVWPDAYYISTREFLGTTGPFQGVGAYAGNRAQMIAGNPSPQIISFLAPPGGTPYNVGDGLLPSDLDGTTMPPANSPNYFMGSMDNNGPYGAPQDALTLWKFVVNFDEPPSSSFTLANTLNISSYNTAYPCAGRACIPQPGTTNRIDILSYRQRPTMRLAYRNFGTHESLVTNQSVNAGDAVTPMAGMRWWEIRSPNSSPVVYQDSTFAPGLTDGIHRWMGSIAMDRQGNMALAYSVSSSTVFPGIRYTGRLASDPINTMPQGEGVIIEGTGSQTSAMRWGDYSHTALDPTDDCTFWHTNEWVPTTSASGWRMRIGAFKFDECSGGSPTPTPSPCPACTPTPTRTTSPTTGATNTRTITSTPSITPTVCGTYTIATSTATVISGTNDIGNHGDDIATLINFPFPVQFYNSQTHNSASVTSNGNLQFTTANTNYMNVCMPDLTLGPAILPHWEDQRTDTIGTCTPGPCGIYTTTMGTAPNRTFVIEWRTYYFAGTGSANYNLLLHEGSPNFEVIIGTLGQTGVSATLGVQDGASRFTQFSCNTAVANGLQLSYTLTGCGSPQPTSTPTATGPVPPTNTVTRTNTSVPGTPTPTSTGGGGITATRTSTPTVVPGTPTPTSTSGGPSVTRTSTHTAVPGTVTSTETPGGPTHTVTATATPCTLVFSDVNEPDYFYVPVMYLACNGVISGYADGTFLPYNNVTRGQTCKIVALSQGWPLLNPPDPTFSDVPPDSVFYTYIETSAAHGVISGYADGTFLPGNNVTRGQTSKIVVLAEEWDIDTTGGPHFSDVPPDHAFYDFIETAYNHGIISGYTDGTFHPGDYVTRGQLSKIVYLGLMWVAPTPTAVVP